ncbi:pilus assembly protein TadG-related protein [Bordetella sp. BOR01]|uniref:pilus assembly protein TadG-related protein n=1 Tax=Bordetella sp. BOR01 TaxID=2854779 RepID=UPI001C474C7B|nr:pilus assembly protein TadG-related protein [Bordetella sp. BOR01]MBV7486661.1 hypothetical protein [Bordetella sp. BOR01]
MSPLPHHSPVRARQRGSIAVSAAFAVLIGLVVLLSVQVGYLFYMKRELQKAADLAALSAAQVLVAGDDACAAGASPTLLAAKGAAVKNVAGIVDTIAASDVTVDCKLWDPNRPDAGGMYLFDPDPSKGERLNAVRVRIDKALGALIPSVVGGWIGGTQASVVAVAAASKPTAAFSVGSKLLGTESTGALMSLLRVVGVDPDLSLVGYEGLVGATITPAGLLRELGIPVTADLNVGDLNALLAANQVSVGQLLDAVVNLAGHDELLGLNAAVLNAIGASLNMDSLNVQLGTEAAEGAMRGLFAAITAPTTAQEALGIKLDALGLITSAIGVATAGNAAAIDIPASGLLSALGLDLSVKAAVVEPPSIGIGQARHGAIPGARAYTSQIRLNLNIGTSSSGLGGLLGALGTSITLPIFVDVVNAQGELTETMCSERPRKAAVEVKSAVLGACLGKPISMADAFSKKDMCATNMSADTEFVRLLGVSLLHGKVAPLSILPAPAEEVIVAEDGPPVSTSANPLALGATISGLLDELLSGSLSGGTQTKVDPLPADTAQTLADNYLNRIGPSITGTEISRIKNWMDTDGLVWKRPGGLLGLTSVTMPEEWVAKVASCRSGSTYGRDCVRGRLVSSLQSPNQCGLLSCILDPIVGLLLGTGDGANGLLQTILKPIVELLKLVAPALDGVGGALSSLLNTLGLNLGPVDVQLHSIDCGQVSLVY